MKQYLIYLGLIVVFGGVLFYISKVQPTTTQYQTDAYGCLLSSGYSYNVEIGACARSWELNNTDAKSAAKVAADLLSHPRGLVISSIEKTSCVNCFTVHLKKGSDGVAVSINNNTVQKVVLDNP